MRTFAWVSGFLVAGGLILGLTIVLVWGIPAPPVKGPDGFFHYPATLQLENPQVVVLKGERVGTACRFSVTGTSRPGEIMASEEIAYNPETCTSVVRQGVPTRPRLHPHGHQGRQELESQSGETELRPELP